MTSGNSQDAYPSETAPSVRVHMHASRDADRNGARGDVTSDHRICADLGIIAYNNRSEDLGPCSDIHMSADGDPFCDCNLLEKQTVYPDVRLWMHNNTIRMGQQ